MEWEERKCTGCKRVFYCKRTCRLENPGCFCPICIQKRKLTFPDSLNQSPEKCPRVLWKQTSIIGDIGSV